ncbi:MAG: hypothetical protein D6B26_06960 [Spirochaetaceae bacterium]|nr:MAG: hypothetical protein D6B26_06960 [Spirochaetaceae bacterium]
MGYIYMEMIMQHRPPRTISLLLAALLLGCATISGLSAQEIQTPSQQEQLQQRIQAHIQPEEIPPPGADQLRNGVFSILGGVLLSGLGLYASVQSFDYAASTPIGFLLRTGTVVGNLSGAIMIATGMYSVNKVAELSAELAGEADSEE